MQQYICIYIEDTLVITYCVLLIALMSVNKSSSRTRLFCWFVELSILQKDHGTYCRYFTLLKIEKRTHDTKIA